VTYLVTNAQRPGVTRRCCSRWACPAADRIEEHGTADPGAGHGGEHPATRPGTTGRAALGLPRRAQTLPFGTVVTCATWKRRTVTVTIKRSWAYLPGRVSTSADGLSPSPPSGRHRARPDHLVSGDSGSSTPTGSPRALRPSRAATESRPKNPGQHFLIERPRLRPDPWSRTASGSAIRGEGRLDQEVLGQDFFG